MIDEEGQKIPCQYDCSSPCCCTSFGDAFKNAYNQWLPAREKKEDFLEFAAITLLKDNMRILSPKSVFKSNDSKDLSVKDYRNLGYYYFSRCL